MCQARIRLHDGVSREKIVSKLVIRNECSDHGQASQSFSKIISLGWQLGPLNQIVLKRKAMNMYEYKTLYDRIIEKN